MDEEPHFLELLIEHESAVGRLYEVFASLSPDREEFWRSLATAEQMHAEKLGELDSVPSVDRWLSHDSGLRPQAIKSSIGYVESQIERAQEGRLSSLQALSIAKDLENALIEEQFSRMSDSIHAEASPILEELAAETETHRKILAEALEAERRLRL
jgi:hypothetical protein